MTALPIDIDPTRIEVRAATLSSGTVVHVTGEVDSTTAPGLRACLLEVLARADDGAIEVDLRQVTFLDSAGLSALATAHRAARGRRHGTCGMRCGIDAGRRPAAADHRALDRLRRRRRQLTGPGTMARWTTLPPSSTPSSSHCSASSGS